MSCPSRVRNRNSRATTATLISGIGISAKKVSTENHFLKMTVLMNGVATDTAAMPKALTTRAPRAQPTAARCRRPSVFRISQPAPSRQ